MEQHGKWKLAWWEFFLTVFSCIIVWLFSCCWPTHSNRGNMLIILESCNTYTGLNNLGDNTKICCLKNSLLLTPKKAIYIQCCPNVWQMDWSRLDLLEGINILSNAEYGHLDGQTSFHRLKLMPKYISYITK